MSSESTAGGFMFGVVVCAVLNASFSDSITLYTLEDIKTAISKCEDSEWVRIKLKSDGGAYKHQYTEVLCLDNVTLTIDNEG